MYHSDDKRPILPICFCIHRNVTMGSKKNVDGVVRTRLSLITEGIRAFVAAGLRSDAPCIPDVALLLFAGSSSLFRPFSIPEHVEEFPELADDTTPDCCMGVAVNNALDAIESRVSMYRAEGARCLRPILVVVSAGRENDGPEEVLERASERCREKIRRGELTAVLYGTTVNTSLELLRMVAPGGTVESVEMREIPRTLELVWKYAKLEPSARDTAKQYGNASQQAAKNTAKRYAPTPEPEECGDASSYILGIFTDME